MLFLMTFWISNICSLFFPVFSPWISHITFKSYRPKLSQPLSRSAIGMSLTVGKSGKPWCHLTVREALIWLFQSRYIHMCNGCRPTANSSMSRLQKHTCSHPPEPFESCQWQEVIDQVSFVIIYTANATMPNIGLAYIAFNCRTC